MTESPKISLVSESLRNMNVDVESMREIWRHEGLKKGVERILEHGPRLSFTRWVMEHAAGGVATDTRLFTEVAGLHLDGPVGIAPGWDKTGKTVLGWQTLGANHITPGGVTLFPQSGNRMPRLRTFDHRVRDGGTSKSLNAYGFPSLGADTVAYNIAKQKEAGDVDIPVIVQVTLNKEMYEEGNRDAIPGILATTIRKVLPVADGINLGLSSPNTMGMRDAQAYEFLYKCISTAREAAPDVPLGYKGDGDGGEERLEMYSGLAIATDLDYLELINTTSLAHIKAKYGAEDLPGGLAGADPDYQKLAVDSVKYIYEAVGDRVDIIGMGGVNSMAQAMRLIRAGASAIGINTAVRQLGARAVTIIEHGLSTEMNGFPAGTRLENVIGIDTKRGPKVPLAA